MLLLLYVEIKVNPYTVEDRLCAIVSFKVTKIIQFTNIDEYLTV